MPERAFDEALKQIRKLRWIGREFEAQELQAALSAHVQVRRWAEPAIGLFADGIKASTGTRRLRNL